MLMSYGWMVLVFILGGTCGALGMAIFSTLPEGDARDNADFAGISHTR